MGDWVIARIEPEQPSRRPVSAARPHAHAAADADCDASGVSYAHVYTDASGTTN
ncbi:MAG: hypothetical protein ACK4OK_03265 [Thermoflexus sp.]